MRCYCCNRNLSDYESTLRSKTTGEFLDMCGKCLKDTDITYIESKHVSNTLIDLEDDDGTN